MIVILNAGAGSAAAAANIRADVAAAFERAGVAPEIVTPDHANSLPALARRAVADRQDAIIAAGGDGTINAVAAELTGSGIAFGVLPLGTLNHFAKDLQLPIDLDGAVRTIAAGHISDVDAASVNDRVFVNNSSLGIYPQIVSKRLAQQERLARGKWPAFLWATIHALHRFPFLDLSVVVNGEKLERRTAFLFVGNNEYQVSGFRLGGRARMDTGRLGLYLSHRTGRWGLVRLAVRALFGRLKQAADFEVFTVTEATIRSRRSRLLVAVDGEIDRIETPLRYRSLPGALRVFVPPQAHA